MSVVYSRNMSSNSTTRSLRCTSTPSSSMRFMILPCAFFTLGISTGPLCTKMTRFSGYASPTFAATSTPTSPPPMINTASLCRITAASARS